MSVLLDMAERGLLPDWLIRFGIRLRDRGLLDREDPGDLESRRQAMRDFIAEMRAAPIAKATDEANIQHYEAPADFFRLVLGQRLKYSACYWGPGVRSLDDAEDAMLDFTCTRAELRNGMEVLDLGCGWGSLSLWIAEHYPKCRITAVSNSRVQADTIRKRAAEKDFKHVEVLTADANTFSPNRTFDRIISIEMFEHMRNWHALLARTAQWLDPEGKLFIHIFSHRSVPFIFRAVSEDDWMARNFFTEGLMPSDDLLLYFQEELIVEDHWRVSGLHYMKTADAWLTNLDRHKAEIVEVARKNYGENDAQRWVQRWRMFFLAVSEMWGFNKGEEWIVSHYLLKRR